MNIEMNNIEKDRLENFKSGHVCPDRHPHDGIGFSTQVFQSAGEIGVNTYIKCNRCHCWQDVTEYKDW